MTTSTDPAETVKRLVAGIADIATEADRNWRDAETEDDEESSVAWHSVANRLRALAQPGLDPVMNDGWTLRMLQNGMRDLERHLDDMGLEMGSIGDGPYPPWEVAIEALGDLRMDLAAEKDQALHLALEVERLGNELADAKAEIDELRRLVHDVAEDLERYAADQRPEKLPMSERKLAEVLRKIIEESA